MECELNYCFLSEAPIELETVGPKFISVGFYKLVAGADAALTFSTFHLEGRISYFAEQHTENLLTGAIKLKSWDVGMQRK